MGHLFINGLYVGKRNGGLGSSYCTPLIVEEVTAEYFITEEGDYLIAEE